MSFKKVFCCDICGDTITDMENSRGVQLLQGDSIRLALAGCNDVVGVHFCSLCINGLRDQLVLEKEMGWGIDILQTERDDLKKEIDGLKKEKGRLRQSIIDSRSKYLD